MRKVLIPLVAAASAFAVASPASAQVYGNLGIGLGGSAYDAPSYASYGYGHVRNLQYRVDAIQRQISHLDRYNILSEREARRLRDESRSVERQLRRAGRYGLNPYEARNIEYRIARLEQHVQREASDRNGRWGRHDGRYYGDRDRNHDRDRDWDRDRDDD